MFLLTLLFAKTTYLYLCPKNQKREKLNIKLGEVELYESAQIKFLGIEIDNRLSFKGHFEKVYEKVKKGLNGLILTKNKLNLQSKLNIYHSLIHSHFNYGAIIWASC